MNIKKTTIKTLESEGYQLSFIDNKQGFDVDVLPNDANRLSVLNFNSVDFKILKKPK